MWTNFFVQQDEEGRIGVAGAGAGAKGGRGQRRSHKISDGQDGKIKLAFLVSLVGVTLTVLGVGTEFWAEAAQPRSLGGNRTCQMVHYGLWKGCVRTLRVADVHPETERCGPAHLPAETNCTYFKFFTSGENAVIFKKTTDAELSLAAVVLALMSLAMMATGSICVTMSLSKEVFFFIKPASFCFILSGVLVLLSVLVFHRSVVAPLSGGPADALHHQLSWSAACAGSAGAVLIFGGVLFAAIALPFGTWRRCLPHKNRGT